MMRILIAFFLFINIAYSKELKDSVSTLLASTTKAEYQTNFRMMEKVFYQEKAKYNDKELIALSKKEKEDTTFIIWDTLRVFFSYEIPEESALKSVFMRCYVQKKKFDEKMNKVNYDQWRGCFNYIYKGKIPQFEQKVLECAKQFAK